MTMIMKSLVPMIATVFLLIGLCTSTGTINKNISNHHHHTFNSNNISYQDKHHWNTMQSHHNDMNKISSSQQKAMREMVSDGEEVMPMLQARNDTRMADRLKRQAGDGKCFLQSNVNAGDEPNVQMQDMCPFSKSPSKACYAFLDNNQTELEYGCELSGVLSGCDPAQIKVQCTDQGSIVDRRGKLCCCQGHLCNSNPTIINFFTTTTTTIMTTTTTTTMQAGTTESSSGLSIGAIIGIAVGSVLGAALLIAGIIGICFFMEKCPLARWWASKKEAKAVAEREEEERQKAIEEQEAMQEKEEEMKKEREREKKEKEEKKKMRDKMLKPASRVPMEGIQPMPMSSSHSSSARK